MSRTTEDLLLDEGNKAEKQEPLVVAAVDTDDISCSYSNLHTVRQEKKETCGAFFNRTISQVKGDYYIFMGRGFEFSTTATVDILIRLFKSKKLMGFGGIYTDLLIVDGDTILCTKHNPSYDLNLVKQHHIINLPFIVDARFGLPRFKEELDVLSLWDGMIQAMVSAPMYHVASPLFCMENTTVTKDIQNEIRIINETHYS